MQVKYSRQREAILQYLEGREDHPTADQIYMQLRKKDPRISLGTVYRNLSKLAELGEIRTIHAGDGKDHYDPNTSSHSHLICTRCGRIDDIAVVCPEEVTECAAAETRGNIENAELFFYGLCEACVKEEAGKQ